MARSPNGTGSGVMLRHRTAAAACACLTVDGAVAACSRLPIQSRTCLAIRISCLKVDDTVPYFSFKIRHLVETISCLVATI